MYPVTPSSAIGELFVLSSQLSLSATLKVLLLAAIFFVAAPPLSLVGSVQRLLNFGYQIGPAVQRPAAYHYYKRRY